MFNISQLAKALFPVLLANAALASPPKKGPVVVNYGPVFEVPATAYNLKAGVRYRVSMDVAATAADQTAVNRNLESAARFLNMQAQAGGVFQDSCHCFLIFKLPSLLHSQAFLGSRIPS